MGDINETSSIYYTIYGVIALYLYITLYIHYIYIGNTLLQQPELWILKPSLTQRSVTSWSKYSQMSPASSPQSDTDDSTYCIKLLRADCLLWHCCFWRRADISQNIICHASTVFFTDGLSSNMSCFSLARFSDGYETSIISMFWIDMKPSFEEDLYYLKQACCSNG